MSEGAPIIFKLGGSAIETPEAHAGLWRDFAEANRAMPGRLVIVHGGGAAIDERLRRLGLTPMKREGIRVTPEEHLPEVVGVLRGIANTALVGALLTAGCRAVGLALGDGGLTRAAVTTRYTFDAGRVGDVVGGDSAVVRALLGAAFVPVIAPIGLDANGRALNINGDDAAAALVPIVGAALLVLLTDVPGVLDERRERIAELHQGSAEELIAKGVIQGGMVPKVRGAVRAAREAGVPVVIAPWGEPGVVGRLLKGDNGVGTRITSSP